MVTICASHNLIVYEHYGGSEGERSIYWCIANYRTVALKGALRYVSINKFNCSFLIYDLLHFLHLGISTTAESCHSNMTLANSMFCKQTDPNTMLPVWHSSESVLFVNIRDSVNYEIDTF